MSQTATKIKGDVPPSWWRTPEQQLKAAGRRWPTAILPPQPRKFTPRTPSEVLLLHVPEQFSRLWRRVPVPSGLEKVREYSILYSSDRYLTPIRREFVTPVWVAFDPVFGVGEAPQNLSSRQDLACSEVLSALIQFPNWVNEWGCGYPEPLMSGYRHRSSVNDPWSDVPRVTKKEMFREFSLDVVHEHWGIDLWASPTVRKV